MSEKLPYEEHLQQQWNDLPLPDENKAWEDMKRRLEEDDDDGIIVWWRRGCMLWGLLLLIVFGFGFWLIKKEKWFIGDSKKTETTIQHKDEAKRIKEKKEDVPVKREGMEKEPGTIQTERIEKKEDNSINKTSVSTDKINTVKIPDETKRIKENKGGIPGQEEKIITTNRKPVIQNGTVTAPLRVAKDKPVTKRPVVDKRIVTGKKKDDNDTPALVSVDKPASTNAGDSISGNKNVPTTVIPNNSVVVKKQPDSTKKKSVIKESSLSTNEAKKDSTKKKPVFFSAGIAMQQLLPVAGQKSTPYNSLGRKGTLADYIPSLYFRVNKKNKWFIQGEFRYGAPQYAKNIVYNQQVKLDTFGARNFTTRSSNTLKKTYYHQLPVTFNYFVVPDWSIGGGFVWNKFVSAISDREVISTNNQTLIDSVVTKGIVRNKNDSSFAKSYFQGVFETQYKWRRFSLGARYAFGLQPYIKFTLITGEQREERNSSLQIFLRYQLWKSKE